MDFYLLCLAASCPPPGLTGLPGGRAVGGQLACMTGALWKNVTLLTAHTENTTM